MANHLTDKVSYIRGLMEGMQFDTTSDEGKLLERIVDLLGDMAEEIGRVTESQDELSEYVDSIDEDLCELEDALFDDEDEEDDDEDDDDIYSFSSADDDDEDEDEDEDDDFEGCDGHCEGCDGCDEIYDEEDAKLLNGDYDEDNIFVECLCPSCKASFYVKEEELSDDAFHICPRCNARVHVVPDYEDDEEIPVAHLAEDDDQ